ncbi:MAG TPA: rhodanese-like domain-containing protein [Usitatibacter sp.]|nr:rhodanese-like domain-containing protein [Usitatibacter sp.]
MGEFIVSNWALVAVFVASGVMLVWPELSRLVGASNEIGTLEATRLMNQAGSLILDVRDGNEYAAGHLPRARHIPLGELSNRIEEIGKYKDKPVIVTCRSGMRAGAAAKVLKGAGFSAVYQLKGGLGAWQQASLPVEK